ncbi:MAG: FkbM family methyltransferase, partial [Phycisphaerae bacterium]
MNERISLDRNPQKCKPNNWLNQYARTVTSQSGEDGIIEKILEVINDNDKWCVEFGSWNGKNLSNTYSLIVDKDYSAVLIEADAERIKDLLRTFGNNPKVTPINALVGFDVDDNLDTILKNTHIPNNFDLLSIDVDGNDYHIWDVVKEYRPKVVVIEFNGTIPPEVEF